MATRLGGGAPHSERQRAEQVWPASVQLTSGDSFTTTPCVQSLRTGEKLLSHGSSVRQAPDCLQRKPAHSVFRRLEAGI